jgi:hypothetical protein
MASGFGQASSSPYHDIWTVITTWKFACSHELTQEKSNRPASPSPFLYGGGRLERRAKSSTQQCPECTEAYENNHKAEQEAARKKAAEDAALQPFVQATLRQMHECMQEAKAKKQEAKSLAIYKSQVVSIEKHIGEAANDEELRAELTIMLKNCKLLWASKVKKAVMEGKDLASTGTISKPELRNKLEKITLMMDGAEILKDKLEKINLMRDRVEILRDEESGKSLFGDEKRKEKLEAQLSDWKRVSAAMTDVVEMYEQRIAPHIEGLEIIEKETHEPWEYALTLMKEE